MLWSEQKKTNILERKCWFSLIRKKVLTFLLRNTIAFKNRMMRL